MSTTRPSPVSSKPDRRPVWIASAAAVAVVVIGLILWFWLGSRVPKPDGSPVAVARYVGSDAFGKLPPEQQKPYREAMFATFKAGGDPIAGLNDADRHSAMRNLYRSAGRERMDAFFDLKTKKEKDAYLDQMMQDRGNRGTRPPRPADAGGNASGTNGSANQNRPRGGRRDPYERPDPVMIARHAEFVGAMRNRMEETGQKSRWDK